MKELIQAVINTLNLVEVRGKENLNRLLGCIQVLGDLLDGAKVSTTEVKEDVLNDDHNEQGHNAHG